MIARIRNFYNNEIWTRMVYWHFRSRYWLIVLFHGKYEAQKYWKDVQAQIVLWIRQHAMREIKRREHGETRRKTETES